MVLTAYDLLWEHRYQEAADVAGVQIPQDLSIDPDDRQRIAVSTRGLALVALGRYADALPLYECQDRVQRSARFAMATPGSPGQQLEISCLRWLLGERHEAILMMRSLVDGVLKGTINYGDMAGAVRQGLLLFYMADTLGRADELAFAMKFFRNRAKRRAIESWPGPLVRYYLAEVDFDFVVKQATHRSADMIATDRKPKSDLMARRRLCTALFHGAVAARRLGNTALAAERMQQCYALENPVLEMEWYIAREQLTGRSS